jgi:hypothetical protein
MANPYADHVDGIGTAGAPAGGVVTVQGIVGGTTQPVTISAPLGTGTAGTGVRIEGEGTADNPVGGVLTVQGPSGGAIEVVGVNSGPVLIQGVRKGTYGASFDTGTGPLLFAIGAAATKQYATIYHGAGATKTVRIQSITFQLHAASAATVLVIKIVRLSATTAPATGNPTINGVATNPAISITPEATLLALPTTPGSVTGAPLSTRVYNIGVTGAANTLNPPSPMEVISLWPPLNAHTLDITDPIIRPGNAEGWAVSIVSSNASTVQAAVQMVFTEE